MRSGPFSYAAVLVLLAACGRTELYPPPLPHNPDASWHPDGGKPDSGTSDGGKPDSGTSDGGCAAPRFWRLANRTITAVTRVESPPPRTGVSERLKVEVKLETSCEVLAGVAVNVQPGNATDFVRLTAQAWVSEPACAQSTSTATRIVLMPGRGTDNLVVVVVDQNSPGGGVRLTYVREICGARIECMCRYDTPVGTGGAGAACVTDCGCARGLSCVGSFGLAGAGWSCVRSCSGPNDCADDERCNAQVPDGVPWSCARAADVCQTGSDCPAGFACVQETEGRRCRDERLYPAAMKCGCDADCPAGQHCTKLYQTPSCEVRCRSTNDCPSKDPTVFACGFEWTCTMLD